MIAGILSDTHDNMHMIQKALDIFRSEGTGLILHAGDFVAPFTLPLYLESGCEFIGVFGNNDGDQLLLDKRSGGRIRNAPHDFRADGKRIVLTHYPDIVSAVAEGGAVDAVIYGHTHEPEIKAVGQTLVINPGECGGWSTGRSTAAILDLAKMEARIVFLDE